MQIIDQNGQRVDRRVWWNPDKRAWGADVYWGGGLGPATTVRRYYYVSRDAARRADLSDDIGKRGRVA